jgi:hypothetical protein
VLDGTRGPLALGQGWDEVMDGWMGKGMGKGTERVRLKQRYRSSCSFSGLHTNCPCRKAKCFAEAAALTVASLAYLRAIRDSGEV